MKKMGGLLLALLLVFVATSCAKNSSQDQVYQELLDAIQTPNIESDLKGKDIQFTAMLLSDPFQVKLEEDVVGTFQYAMLARNQNQFFLLSAAEGLPPKAQGTIVKITGQVQGYINHTTPEGKEIQELEVLASTVDVVPVTEPQNVNTTEGVLAGAGKIVFNKAVLNPVVEGVSLSVDYRSSIKQESVVPLDTFYFSYNDQPLSVDTGPLMAAGSGEAESFTVTLKGEPSPYYTLGEQLLIQVFDDDFQLTYEYTLPLLSA